MADTSMTLGERLEEARKRKGISIREAAEATKVRGDYLLAMENNSFEINLPEIYVRGFCKIYVNFLRLDTEKFMAEFDAMRAGGRKPAHRFAPQPQRREPSSAASQPNLPPTSGNVSAQSRVSFGRMDMPGGAAAESAPEREHGHGPSPVPPGSREAVEGGIPYLKPILAIAAVVFVVVIAGFAISMFSGSGKSAPGTTEVITASRPLTLVATDTVTVLVINRADNTRLFSGSLMPGETRKIEVDGEIDLRYNNGAALQVERDGKRMRVSTSGTGRSIIP
jgi:transcriptional regulator with XRE-family HTH domain